MRMYTNKGLKNTGILAARNTSSHTSGVDIILLYVFKEQTLVLVYYIFHYIQLYYNLPIYFHKMVLSLNQKLWIEKIHLMLEF